MASRVVSERRNVAFHLALSLSFGLTTLLVALPCESLAQNPNGSPNPVQQPRTRPPEFFAYVKSLQTTIKSNWLWDKEKNVPPMVIQFSLAPEGTISDVVVARTSGDKQFDQSVIDAVHKSSPLPPPQAHIYDYFKHVRITFDPADDSTLVPDSPKTQVDADKVVQAEVGKILRAVYAADVGTTLRYTHPKIIQALGGMEKAKQITSGSLRKVAEAGIKLESVTFPSKPTFLQGAENDFVIVPTKSVISTNGQRVESLNFQFGARSRGTSEWYFIEGSRIGPQNVHQLFADFPRDFDFPQVYRKKI